LYFLLRWTGTYLYELAPYAAILYYEIGEEIFSSSTFYYYVQTFITTFMKTVTPTYFIRGCFLIGVFYLTQQRTEEAKLFFL